MPPPLSRLPWDIAKDEFGIEGTDFIGIFGRVLLGAAKDEIGSQVREMAMEFRKHPPGDVKDEIRAGA